MIIAPQIPGTPDDGACTTDAEQVDKDMPGAHIGDEPSAWTVPTPGVSHLYLQPAEADRTGSKCSAAFYRKADNVKSTASKCYAGDNDGAVRAMSKLSNRPDRRSMSKVSNRDREEILEAASRQRMQEELDESTSLVSLQSCLVVLKYIFGICQLYSVPLTTGVITALVWSNVDADSYHNFNESQITQGARLFGHDVTLHFIVNDFFMCFFFGLAVKEVTEALLPGGCLNPLRRAINPIFATVGGVLGPIVVYHIAVGGMYSAGGFDDTDCSASISSSHRRLGDNLHNSTLVGQHADPSECTFTVLAKGWGVPTATDISLAWMFSVIIFGKGHPVINFMLLLAILDDAIGMIIIAVFYSDPAHPVEPVWLLLVGAAVLLALVLRKAKVRSWAVYIVICGPISWLGLIMAHVHPALALVLVIPCLPASHALRAEDNVWDLGACDLSPAEKPEACVSQPEEEPSCHSPPKAPRRPSTTSAASVSSSLSSRAVQMVKSGTVTWLGLDEAEAPLHAFEAALKTPVDFGMFFFGLANAGVSFQAVGSLTGAVLISLCVGKIIGICGFSLLATMLGFALPAGISWGDMVAMSALAGIGLTVALFLANEAFVQPELRDQAKMGAVISVGCAFIAWPIRKVLGKKDQQLAVEELPKAEEESKVATQEATINEDAEGSCIIPGMQCEGA